MSEAVDSGGRGMIALVFALLGGSVATCVVLALTARGDPAFAVEPDYYAKAVAWDERQAEERASDGLGWRVDVAVSPAAGAELELTLTLTDAGGQAIEGARVHLEAFAVARARHVRELDLVESGGTYRGVFDATTPGLWELRLRAVRGAEVMVANVRRDLRSPAR